MQFDAADVNNRQSSLPLYWAVKKSWMQSQLFFEQSFFYIYIYLKKYTIISILEIVKYQKIEKNIEGYESFIFKIFYERN